MKLSIITINYNNAIGLRKTIESVLSQVCQEFEYIVIDGASTDKSVEVIEEYSHRITCWVSEPDKGIYHAMNKGINRANGDYCIFINSGDVFYDSATVSLALPHLDRTAIISGGTVLGNGNNIKKSPLKITFAYLFERSLSHPSTFIQTSLLKKYKYDESLKIVSDWKFWIQTLILENQSYKSIDLIISRFDITGISSNAAINKKERTDVLNSLIPIRILDEYEKGDGSLYLKIRQNKYRKQIYTLIVFVLRFIFLLTNKFKWIKDYPLHLKD